LTVANFYKKFENKKGDIEVGGFWRWVCNGAKKGGGNGGENKDVLEYWFKVQKGALSRKQNNQGTGGKNRKGHSAVRRWKRKEKQNH